MADQSRRRLPCGQRSQAHSKYFEDRPTGQRSDDARPARSVAQGGLQQLLHRYRVLDLRQPADADAAHLSVPDIGSGADEPQLRNPADAIAAGGRISHRAFAARCLPARDIERTCNQHVDHSWRPPACKHHQCFHRGRQRHTGACATCITCATSSPARPCSCSSTRRSRRSISPPFS